MGRPALPELFLFLRKVDASSGHCWLWTAATDRDGYGQMKHGGRQEKAHRVAHRLFVGPVPDGLLVCHSCDTPSCVNPDHLFTGTALANSRDCVTKGRIARGDRCGSRLYPELRARGERVNTAKLTEAQAVEVRERAANGETCASIAAAYGVAHPSVSAIIRGSHWKHAGGPVRPPMSRRERGLRSHPSMEQRRCALEGRDDVRAVLSAIRDGEWHLVRDLNLSKRSYDPHGFLTQMVAAGLIERGEVYATRRRKNGVFRMVTIRLCATDGGAR